MRLAEAAPIGEEALFTRIFDAGIGARTILGERSTPPEEGEEEMPEEEEE